MKDLIEQAAKLLGVRPIELADGSTILHIPAGALPPSLEPTMTSDEFFALVDHRWTGMRQFREWLADTHGLKYSISSCYDWAKGRYPVPPDVRRALRQHAGR